MMRVVAFFGGQISAALAAQVVALINTVGWAFVLAGTLSAILTAGGLAVTSVMIDVLIITVKEYLKKSLKAEAIAF